ncbi:hypothetical protein Kuja_1080 [Vibrio phage vB_VchM_Kuja]|uniref:Uncharacterized protein n=1 Tax=Vibrio phage vB_VchM_Kuja TaxID=2686437 RepID=A0A6B9J9G0_9CAUD|nr:hypothetical protein HWC83_gp128 [Vibrio phage vB_VchM_Kuja]QGZ16099.1 hypothetical protein Kuja_1080 [Vibrio phage vB_VchM_Kuja]
MKTRILLTVMASAISFNAFSASGTQVEPRMIPEFAGYIDGIAHLCPENEEILRIQEKSFLAGITRDYREGSVQERVYNTNFKTTSESKFITCEEFVKYLDKQEKILDKFIEKYTMFNTAKR